MELASLERKTRRKVGKVVGLSDAQNNNRESDKARTSGSEQAFSSRWMSIGPDEAELDPTVSPEALETSSESPNQTARESTRYHLQRIFKTGSITSDGPQIVWSHKDSHKSTKYHLRSEEPSIIVGRETSTVTTQQHRSVWKSLIITTLAFFAFYLICNSALNCLCKDPSKSRLCHDDRHPRPAHSKFSYGHFNEKIKSVNQKFSELQARNEEVCDFYFALSKSTDAFQKLRTRVQFSTIATRERTLAGLHQYITNAKIHGKLQSVLRGFVASVPNNKDRVELYTKTVIEAIDRLQEPSGLHSKYPALWIMIFWPFWLPLDHFGKHSTSPLYVAASHFDDFVANTMPRSKNTLRLAQNLQFTLLEQIGHLDSLFRNANVVNTETKLGMTGKTGKTGKKAETDKIGVAIISRASRRLSRLWVQTGGGELDAVSKALDWTDGILPHMVDAIGEIIQSMNEISVLLDEIQTYTNNLKEIA
ncbi:hypothetical protein MMC07_000876 [Pseudocyphellaria aurata]|nr:hypothetical protein [Pseudocyphellaria aurata]